MKIFIIAVSFLLASVLTSWAVDTISIDLGGTPEVIAIPAGRKGTFQKLLAKHNRQRAAQIIPLGPLTFEQFIRNRIMSLLSSEEKEGNAVTTVGDADFCTVFNNSSLTSGAERSQVIAVGNGASPCP